jgi:heat shock protein HslJ
MGLREVQIAGLPQLTLRYRELEAGKLHIMNDCMSGSSTCVGGPGDRLGPTLWNPRQVTGVGRTMRLSPSLAILLVLATACTSTRSDPSSGPSRSGEASSSEPGLVAPDVVGENFLEALVAVEPPFRLLELRYRVAPGVANGTILEQRPPPGTRLDPNNTEILVIVSISPAEQLRGTDWVLTVVDGRTWPVGNAPDVTLHFGLHRLRGFSGCNDYSADYEMDGRRLIVGRVATTLKLTTQLAPRTHGIGRAAWQATIVRCAASS